MIGYVSSEDLSLKDCYEIIKGKKTTPVPRSEVNARYNILMQEWKDKDDNMFAKCKTLSDYKKYLKYHSEHLEYYTPRHSAEANNQIIKLKNEEEVRKASEQVPPPITDSSNNSTTVGSSSSSSTTSSGDDDDGCVFWIVVVIIAAILFALIG